MYLDQVSAGDYDVVIAGAWYWRCGYKSIPHVIHEKLGRAYAGRVIVLSDDIHHLRVSQTGETRCGIRRPAS